MGIFVCVEAYVILRCSIYEGCGCCGCVAEKHGIVSLLGLTFLSDVLANLTIKCRFVLSCWVSLFCSLLLGLTFLSVPLDAKINHSKLSRRHAFNEKEHLLSNIDRPRERDPIP